MALNFDQERDLEMLKFNQQRALEILKSLVQISLEGFKILALLNGGAAVALLAYLGNIAARTDLPKPDVTGAMLSFVIGLVCCGGGIFCGYQTQLIYYNEFLGGRELMAHSPWLTWAKVLTLLSLLCFLAGCLLATVKLAG